MNRNDKREEHLIVRNYSDGLLPLRNVLRADRANRISSIFCIITITSSQYTGMKRIWKTSKIYF